MFMSLLKRATNRAIWLLPSSGTIKGYDDPELIEFVFRKTQLFKAVDPWPEMAGIASVLDFGGGFGSHYRRAQQHSPDIRWAVVETPETAERAAELATESLRFFSSIGDATSWLGPVEVVYSNAALHCTPEPERYLSELCAVRAKTLIWDRTLLSSDGRRKYVDRNLLAENGPGVSLSRRRVEVEMIRMAEKTFLETHRDYILVKREGRQDDRAGENFVFKLSA